MAGAYYNPHIRVIFNRPGSLAPVGRPSPAQQQPVGISPGGGPQPVGNPPSSGGVGSGGAGPAVQAGLNLAAGGTPIDKMPGMQSTVAPAMRDDEFIGLRTDASPSSLPIVATPYSVNWDDIERMGTLGVRRGLLMLSDSKRTVDGGSTYASYYGSGVCAIPPSDFSEAANKGGLLLFGLSSSPTFGAAGITNAAWVVRTQPLWSRDRDLDFVSTLSIVVSCPASGTLRVVATDSGGVNTNAIVARMIRYSTVGYPVSIDGDDEFSSTAMSDRVAWTGASTGNLDATGLAAGVYYVSAWALSRKGSTTRAIGKVTVT